MKATCKINQTTRIIAFDIGIVIAVALYLILEILI